VIQAAVRDLSRQLSTGAVSCDLHLLCISMQVLLFLILTPCALAAALG
jgi:hypothetical protein